MGTRAVRVAGPPSGSVVAPSVAIAARLPDSSFAAVTGSSDMCGHIVTRVGGQASSLPQVSVR
ncbi:hypothetical protein GCM10010347_16820 [Streptomyces cirratus]|uniref:Uncharacterized protein n=1 Tax=Streptomyces cirratus TaxID=68187 RepID=A0ABQ3EN26_9ACTN|nr:hypothetical protein GCM10010347_16820 [Streptomyces cirratus]